MAFRENGNSGHLCFYHTSQWIKQTDALDLLVEQFHPHRVALGVGGKDIDNVTAYPVGAALKIHIVAGVLQLGKLAQDVALGR